jgi:RHS repeat-associated protein
MEKITLGYIGQRQSVLKQHYLLGNGYRAFNPLLKRFSAWDSASPFGVGGTNGYAYCSGNPVNHSDPSGHIGGFWACIFGMVTDVVVEDAITTTADLTVEAAGTLGLGRREATHASVEIDRLTTLPQYIQDDIYDRLDLPSFFNLASIHSSSEPFNDAIERLRPRNDLHASLVRGQNLASRQQRAKYQVALLQEAWGNRKTNHISSTIFQRLFDQFIPGAEANIEGTEMSTFYRFDKESGFHSRLTPESKWQPIARLDPITRMIYESRLLA